MFAVASLAGKRLFDDGDKLSSKTKARVVSNLTKARVVSNLAGKRLFDDDDKLSSKQKKTVCRTLRRFFSPVARFYFVCLQYYEVFFFLVASITLLLFWIFLATNFFINMVFRFPAL